MKMREFVQIPAVTCSPEATVGDAARLLDRFNVGSLIVADSGRILGIVTDRDIALRCVAHGLAPSAPVTHVMTHTVATVAEGAELAEAADIMAAHGVRRLPVIDADGRPVGVVALDDLTRYLGKELDALTRALSAQIDTVHYAGWTDWDG